MAAAHSPSGTGDSGADRLTRAVDMVDQAVALLLQVMEEFKSEKGFGTDDDSDAACPPDGIPE